MTAAATKKELMLLITILMDNINNVTLYHLLKAFNLILAVAVIAIDIRIECR